MLRYPILYSLLVLILIGTSKAAQPTSARSPSDVVVIREFVESNCLDCHDSTSRTAGIALDELLLSRFSANTEPWEAVVRKLATRQMPPATTPRPDEKTYHSVMSALTSQLDAIAQENPNPGRTETLRRMTRTEYRNAIRDLLALQVDVDKLLPMDESSDGFDNITVTDLSPTLLGRYVSAAQKISRMAVGNAAGGVRSETFRVRPDITQDHNRVAGLPLGTRGGTLISYYFPRDGEYEIQAWLMRDRNDEIESLRGTNELEVLIDRSRAAVFKIVPPPRGTSDQKVDANLKTRLKVTAGQHDLGVTFVKKPFSLQETERQPLNAHYNFYRHPRLGPAVYQVSITGPLKASGPGDTASRRRIFTCLPSGNKENESCARRILLPLVRRAYRRPVDDSDLEIPMDFFAAGLREGGFELGIERAITHVLVNPNFLLRIERQPEKAAHNQPYRISDFELASRLSFFLWSSIPDDTLLDLAERGDLNHPEVLQQQVRRMLADERSSSLTTNFADQWLYLRNLDSFAPDARLYPDFDHNLREAFRQETELLFRQMVRDDQSVLVLLNSPVTYLNERLARHYGVPHVYGSHFRRVQLDQGSRRGGILRHASILSVTSLPTRTSPVLRGKWILKNLLGTPPSPPPPDIPALEDNTVAADLPIRERLAAHRANAACAICHDTIDPAGFALENYDAVGRWRELEKGQPVDATGGLPDGSEFEGVYGLEQALLARPEVFVQTMTEKLMTFALGRGIQHYDAPAVRRIVSRAKQDDYRFSALILEIVRSRPFQMRMAKVEPAKARED